MRRIAMRAGLAVLAALVFSLSAGAMTATDVAERLRDRIVVDWKVKNLEVTVAPYSQAETERGRFKSITVRADSAEKGGIAMRPMYVKGTDVVLDLGMLFSPGSRVETKYRGATEMYIELSEEDMNEGLRQAQDVVPDLKATLQNGQITLTGTYKLLVGNKFKMSGRLEVPDGYKINFVPTAAKVNGIPVPVSAVKTLLSRLNPILDLATVGMKPRISSLTIEDGKLTAK